MSCGPDARRIAVEVVVGHRLLGRLAFQHLETVGGHQHRMARLVQAVVGPPDPLDQPRGALGRGELDDEVDGAPVDAEVERRGADHRPQFPARHRRLDLAASARPPAEPWCRAIGRRVVVVQLPARPGEGHFRLEAGVDEDQRRPRQFDDLSDRPPAWRGGRSSRSRAACSAVRMISTSTRGRRARTSSTRSIMVRPAPAAGLSFSGASSSGVVDRGREAHPPAGSAHSSAGAGQAEDSAGRRALGAVKGVDLVEDHRVQPLEIGA